jgi:hypothetical protein
MRKSLLMAVVFGLVSTAAAQTSNTLGSVVSECKLTQAPAIRGIRLGMSAEQMLAQIPGSEADSDLLARLSRDYFGSRSAILVPGNYVTSKEKFAGIKSINVTLLDGRLVSLYIEYDGPQWSSDKQFVARLAELLNLPGVGSWKYGNSGGLAIVCDGFEISARIPGPVIGIKDTKVDTDKLVREREEVPKEKARRAFKP